MKLLMKYIIFGQALALALIGCASKDVQIVEKDTQAYQRVEVELQKPFISTTNSDIKVLVEKNHPDFADLVIECIFAEKYLSDRSCSSRKRRGPQSLAINCVAAEDWSSPAAERGTCAKLICIDEKSKDCWLEGNSAISF